MKTQPISSQNFTAGEIKFVNRHFVSKPFDKISLSLPQQLGNSLNRAAEKISGKDYDIFVMRSWKNHHIFEIRADKEYCTKSNSNSVFVHENLIAEAFESAISRAIKLFEKK